MKIIYMHDSGTVAVVHATDEALEHMTIIEIALKDVPTGKKFKIVDDSYIPMDREYRAAWVVDESELTDGVGA
jgi:hypothetical protein